MCAFKCYATNVKKQNNKKSKSKCNNLMQTLCIDLFNNFIHNNKHYLKNHFKIPCDLCNLVCDDKHIKIHMHTKHKKLTPNTAQLIPQLARGLTVKSFWINPSSSNFPCVTQTKRIGPLEMKLPEFFWTCTLKFFP